MRKFLNAYSLVMLIMTGCMLTACSDDNEPSESYEPPTLKVNVNAVERAYVEFTIESTDGTDYAYIITEKGENAPESAEDIFKNGTSGILPGSSVKVKTPEVEGGKEFVIYSAVRKINPYIYSQIEVTDINTDIPYSGILTMNKIGFTDFAYHVEIPAEATNMKHLAVRKADYLAIKAILGSIAEVTPEMYLETFGLPLAESDNFAYDKFGKDANGIGFDIHIHSNNTFLIMAGVVDEDGKVDPTQFKCIEFKTRTADVSPYDFTVDVTTTSTTSTINITPDEAFTEYRLVILSKSDYNYTMLEGEEQLRYDIIAHWDDSTNPIQHSYNGPAIIKSEGLIPNTQYVLCLIGFDAQGREKLTRIDYVTGEPTGPAPTIEVTATQPSTATLWNSAAYKVKATNAADVRYGFWTKAGFDRVLNNGYSEEDVILSNGVPCNADELSNIQSDQGMIFEINTLEPETEYIFGIYARTNEYVTAVETRTFTTEEIPQIGGDIRKNMPGHYIAATTDENGATVTFPVTIVTGVNNSTIEEYASKNRLVALGFGPESQFPYISPSEINSENPLSDYGPKWFIEFSEDGIKVPNGGNKDWNMGLVNGSISYLKGYGFRETANGPRELNFPYDDFDVEVSEDGNTITVKGNFHEIGNGGYTYPTMYTPGSGFWSPDVILFRAYSDIVLTRQSDNKSESYKLNSISSMPQIKVIKTYDPRENRANLEKFINKLN
ncbi:MAG: hypothetical protein K2G21_04870 [Muribaculaceae bacterium]|nr:hypothetical protein [Muribaculaceae bacterium]